MFYESLILLPIYSMEAFSGSNHKVTSLREMCYFPLTSEVSILSLLDPATLLLGWRYLKRQDFSLAFSDKKREFILDSS